jgi:hypothetical protein
VGTRGIHNYSISNLNRSFDGAVYEGDPIVTTTDPTNAIYGTNANEFSSTANHTNYQYGSVNWRGADGDSYYHGFTAELRSADLHQTGLNVRADYTWSHSIDNTSSAFSDSGNTGAGGLVLGYTDPWNHRLDRGSSDFDQRQRGLVTIAWTIPYANHLTGASKILLDNWTLADTFDAQTGTPFTEFDCSYGNTVCPRASFVTDPPRKKVRGLKDMSTTYGANTYSYMTLPKFWDPNGDTTDYPLGVLTTNYSEQLNPVVDAYTLIPNVGGYDSGSDSPICSAIHGVGCHLNPGMDNRNQFHGPGTWHDNLGIVKDFKIHGRYDLQLKGEFINVFNHANTYLNLGGANDVSSYTEVLAYKGGLGTNRNTELSLHLSF